MSPIPSLKYDCDVFGERVIRSVTANAREDGFDLLREAAAIPDLDACSAFGKTPAEALKQAEVAKRAWLAAARTEKKPIPKPRYRPAIYQTGT